MEAVLEQHAEIARREAKNVRLRSVALTHELAETFQIGPSAVRTLFAPAYIERGDWGVNEYSRAGIGELLRNWNEREDIEYPIDESLLTEHQAVEYMAKLGFKRSVDSLRRWRWLEYGPAYIKLGPKIEGKDSRAVRYSPRALRKFVCGE